MGGIIVQFRTSNLRVDKLWPVTDNHDITKAIADYKFRVLDVAHIFGVACDSVIASYNVAEVVFKQFIAELEIRSWLHKVHG